jgi:hypothetical protein
MCAWENKHMGVKGLDCETIDGIELYRIGRQIWRKFS